MLPARDHVEEVNLQENSNLTDVSLVRLPQIYRASIANLMLWLLRSSSFFFSRGLPTQLAGFSHDAIRYIYIYIWVSILYVYIYISLYIYIDIIKSCILCFWKAIFGAIHQGPANQPIFAAWGNSLGHRSWGPFWSQGLLLWICGWRKSCTILDGWNPVNNEINHLSTGAGCLPSTVCQWLISLSLI